MSSKKKQSQKHQPEIPEEKLLPLMERPRFRLFYQIVVYTILGAGVILLVLYYTIWQDQAVALFSSLGVLGVGIILFTMRSTRKHSAPPEEEEEKDEDTLQMRTRR